MAAIGPSQILPPPSGRKRRRVAPDSPLSHMPELCEKLESIHREIEQTRDGLQRRIPIPLREGAELSCALGADGFTLTGTQRFLVNHVLLSEKYQPRLADGSELPKAAGVGSAFRLRTFLDVDVPSLVVSDHGTVLNVFDKKMLASGHFARAFLAQDIHIGEFCIVKEFTAKTKNEENFDGYIKPEIQALKKVGKFIDVVTKEGKPQALIIKYGWGADYLQFLEAHSDSLSFIKKLKMFLAAAIEVQKLHHKHKLIHRDIKLENFLWDDEREIATLIDYGFAVEMDENLSFTGKLVGTPSNMAPELITLENRAVSYSLSTELFALGAMGCSLFSVQQAMNIPLLEQYRMNRRIQNAVPYIYQNMRIFEEEAASNPEMEQLIDLLKRMIDMDPENRPTIIEVITSLESILQMQVEHRKGCCSIL